MNLKNRLGGIKAKANGDHFEAVLNHQATSQGWNVIQIPSGSRWISKFKTIPIATPFDFVLAKDWPHVIYCDAKTTQAGTFPAAKIKKHQMEWLSKLHARGFTAGYIINYANLDLTCFFSGDKLQEHFLTKKGLKPQDGIKIGTNTKINFYVRTTNGETR